VHETAEPQTPHAGRMYDYVIGGTHNFEIDRLAAEQFVKLVPSIPMAARQNRIFLKVAAERWQQDGIDHILDLGSGLPTQGHLNEYLPDAHILFTDRDELTVKYGQEILNRQSGHDYLQLDVSQTDLLETAVKQTFGDHPRLGIGFVGLSYFFSEEELRKLAQALYSLAAPGSVLAMTSLHSPNQETASTLTAEYDRVIHSTLYLRAPEELPALLAPWAITSSQQVQHYENEHNSLPTESQDDSLEMHGTFATHP
jgi:O-methyltransferase involved in polyketide biosynthesis